MTDNIYKLKIFYSQIVTDQTLMDIIPLTLVSRAKEVGYTYYNNLAPDAQYKIAIKLFKRAGIIHTNELYIQVLDYAKLQLNERTDQVPVSSIPQDELINNFILYNINVQNLFAVVYPKENVVAVAIPSFFMDTTLNDITRLQTKLDEFILDAYTVFLSTPAGTVPFIPWFGTNLKKYLHDMTPYQAEEMLQFELDGLTINLRRYLSSAGLDSAIEFSADVNLIENEETSQVIYKIVILINNKSYTIEIK